MGQHLAESDKITWKNLVIISGIIQKFSVCSKTPTNNPVTKLFVSQIITKFAMWFNNLARKIRKLDLDRKFVSYDLDYRQLSQLQGF
jgi:hypothetical protein